MYVHIYVIYKWRKSCNCPKQIRSEYFAFHVPIGHFATKFFFQIKLHNYNKILRDSLPSAMYTFRVISSQNFIFIWDTMNSMVSIFMFNKIVLQTKIIN